MVQSDNLEEPTLHPTAYVVDIAAHRRIDDVVIVKRRRYTVAGIDLEMVRERVHDNIDAAILALEGEYDDEGAA